ncbi:DUF2142 domain-containing protein [Saccharothrix sp.]|uniref:DUF2142 domain-containing protein n=1 Tax=Saccharothrix sp. TaxID=1873460 RepID=UPI002810C3E5|nr:DUF2142 domain-containing protein [Saccharothrix sp.]
MTNRPSGARLWLLAFIGFWLLHAGWAFAAPFDGPPDEEQHALRAAAIMNGDIFSREGNGQLVPQSLDKNNKLENGVLRHRSCFPMQVTVPASCTEEPGGDRTLVVRYVSEARFNPVYYAVVGWPLKFWPEWRGIMLSRLISAGLMAAMLACAVVGAVRWTRHRALLAGIVVAVTPMTAHLAGSINPNGIEITAGLCLGVALIALLHERGGGPVNKAAVALAAVSSAVIVTPRFSGVMWLCVIAFALLVPVRWQRVKELVRTRAVQVGLGAVVLAGIASVLWTFTNGTAEVAPPRYDYQYKDVLKVALLDFWPNLANQMVGVMGWAETLMPRLIYVVWFAALGVLILGGFIVGGRVDRWRMIALFFGTFTPLLAAELYLINQTGWFNQGRYFLPGAVVLPLLGAHILAKNALTAAHFRSATRVFALLLLPIHLVCVAFTMIRWQSGLAIMNPFKGSWVQPYGGHVLPLAAATLGVIVLFAMFWWASRVPTEPAAEVEAEPVSDDTTTIEAVPHTDNGETRVPETARQ